MTDYRKIVFGKTDAREESAEYPDLLMNGYFPVDNISEQVLKTDKFIILGNKGSGKTALSEYLKLTSDANTIVDGPSLKSFPFKVLGKIVAGESEPVLKHKLAWRWLLLVRVLQNLVLDPDAKPSTKKDLRKTTEFLVQSGLMDVDSLSDLVKLTSSLSVKAFSIEHTTREETADVSLDLIINYVKDLVVGFKESHRHLLVIDGVDEILTARGIPFLSVVAMIHEAQDLNLFFRAGDLPVKIIILCRTDLFERLPDPDKNKLRRDCSCLFNWYPEGSDAAKDSDLMSMVNMRARLIFPEVDDLFDEFFPSDYRGHDIRSEMLGFTRFTPRDLLQLLVSIQNRCTAPRVSAETMEKGLADYSLEYFLPEIKDEMAGYLPFDSIDAIMEILASFRSREFSFSAFDQAVQLSARLSGLSSSDILRVLFDCSAIGLASPSGEGGRFKYRNRHASCTQSDRFVIHQGLCKGLDITL